MTGGVEEATGTPRPITGVTGDEPVAAADAAAADVEAAEERGATVDGTRFAHASEAEMARILDFYDVRWEYEPTTFPILWNTDGEVIESFAPDFYLPDLEMFLEMTTLKQRLVRKKNRKLRRLRELYPDVRIKLFYARDFRAMMLKYGRYALFESLAGTPGQVIPERPAPALPDGAPAAVLAAASVPVAAAVPAATERQQEAVEPPTEPLTERTLSDATPRSRSARRRRRRRALLEVAAEQESGA